MCSICTGFIIEGNGQLAVFCAFTQTVTDEAHNSCEMKKQDCRLSINL